MQRDGQSRVGGTRTEVYSPVLLSPNQSLPRSPTSAMTKAVDKLTAELAFKAQVGACDEKNSRGKAEA